MDVGDDVDDDVDEDSAESRQTDGSMLSTSLNSNPPDSSPVLVGLDMSVTQCLPSKSVS